VQVAVPLADTAVGPGDANVVVGSAATAGTESVGDAFQLFFSVGDSFAVSAVVQVALLPGPATMTTFAADAGRAVTAMTPPAANPAASADLRTVLSMQYPPGR
jgi:hypothetical protein